MAARSPEPAKRCDRPQSFSASARGPPSRLDVGEDFDRGGEPRGRASSAGPSRMRTMKMIHIDQQHHRADAVERRRASGTLLLVTWTHGMQHRGRRRTARPASRIRRPHGAS